MAAPGFAEDEPEKTIPRATILGTLGVAALYLLSTFSVFANAVDAVLAAADVLQGLSAIRTPELPLCVRIAVHTGDAAPRDGDFFSPVVNTCARLRGDWADALRTGRVGRTEAEVCA